jgi:hypothetical protein
LFTVQYPSNWTVSNVAIDERSGPIDIVFFAPVKGAEDTAELEFIQYSDLSVFNTAQESLESEIIGYDNDPTLAKFEIERPIECQKYTLNGLEACSYIAEMNSQDEKFAVLAVDAVAPDGTEYEAYYRGSFNLFESFLPTVENMIKSFKATGTDSAAATDDFSLNDSLNDTSTSTNPTGLDQSDDEDFSLGEVR